MTLQKLKTQSIRYLEAINRQNAAPLASAHIMKRDSISDFEATIYNPVACLILQGRKVTSIGDQSASVSPGNVLLVSHDLPVTSQITQASLDKPYLALVLTLDIGTIRSLYEQVSIALPEENDAKSLSVTSQTPPNLIDALMRYLNLVGKPIDTNVLGPLILREIHFQLLMSDIGGMLRNLLTVNSHASQIAKAIALIRENYHSPLVVAELARKIGMSQSSFHTHFKSITGTTPIQYQKDLRMIEAQRLLFKGNLAVSTVSVEVGYESPTHFSRDYSRKFGCSPKHHLGSGSPV